MSKKILVVDDDDALVKVFSLRLKGAGFETDTAENGQVALEKIKTAPPDVILLDIQMPVMTGTELASEMARDPALANIPILFMTGKVDLEKEPLPRGPHTDVLIKPCNFEELIEKVGKLAA